MRLQWFVRVHQMQPEEEGTTRRRQRGQSILQAFPHPLGLRIERLGTGKLQPLQHGQQGQQRFRAREKLVALETACDADPRAQEVVGYDRLGPEPGCAQPISVCLLQSSALL